MLLETGWEWDFVGRMELWQALALTEYRYFHPSADSLVAAYLGYKPSRALVELPTLSEEEKQKWERTGVVFSPHAPPVEKLPNIIKERFPFLVQGHA